MDMNMSETTRIILGLRAKGWTGDEICNFILYVETGDEKYNPENKPEQPNSGSTKAGAKSPGDMEGQK